MKDWIIYAGAYAPFGLYRFAMDAESGKLRDIDQLDGVTDVKYLAQTRDHLALACRMDNDAGVCFISKGQAKTNPPFCRQGQGAPCYVGVFEDLVMTANYHDGNIFLYRCKDGNIKEEKTLCLGADAGCHQTMLHRNLLLIPCLKQDCIRIFDLEKLEWSKQRITFPKGSGPRHGIMNPKETRMWIVGELDNCLYEVRISQTADFQIYDSIEIVPEHIRKNSQSAAIRLSPDGRFITVSTRGANVLTTWEIQETCIKPVQQISCGGDQPRDFLMTPDGHFVLSANRGTGEVLCFERDVKSGRIGGQKGQIQVKEVIALMIGAEE